MAPIKKATSQIAALPAAFKGKKIINGGTSNTELHLPNPEVVLEQVEEHLSPTTPPEG